MAKRSRIINCNVKAQFMLQYLYDEGYFHPILIVLWLAERTSEKLMIDGPLVRILGHTKITKCSCEFKNETLNSKFNFPFPNFEQNLFEAVVVYVDNGDGLVALASHFRIVICRNSCRIFISILRQPILMTSRKDV